MISWWNVAQEHIETSRLPEQEVSHKRTFQLVATKKEVGIGNREERTHPVLYVPLMQNDVRLFENLRMRVIGCCPESKTLDLEFEEMQNTGIRKFKIDDVKLEGNILYLGTKVAIVCRKITHYGRAKLYISSARNIRVCSEPPKQTLAA